MPENVGIMAQLARRALTRIGEGRLGEEDGFERKEKGLQPTLQALSRFDL